MPKEQTSNQVESGIQNETVIKEAILQSPVNIKFEFPEHEGRELKPGSHFVFQLPLEVQNFIVRDVVLKHRKGERYQINISSDGYDPYGAYSRVELRDLDKNTWQQWRDPEGYNSDKFAEPRSSYDPEHEILHDWVATVGKIRADEIRVTNVGQHPEYSTSQIHGLEIIFFPNLENTRFEEKIYTSGTAFIDLESNKLLPSYGGGEKTGGIYKDALILKRDRLVLDLEVGQQLIQMEVAVGDTENIGGRTRLGWAKLWVGIQHAGSGQVEWFIQNANVPPQGVIAGGPNFKDSLIKNGDKLVIESRADTSYIMGWRLAYKK